MRCTPAKKSAPPAKSLTAFEAYPRARDLANHWRADSYLVDAISEHIVVSFVQDHNQTPWAWITKDFRFDPVDLKLTGIGLNPDDWPNNQSVVLGWMFVFSSGDDQVVVHVTDKEAGVAEGPVPRDVGRKEVVGWKIDNTKAVESAAAIDQPRPIIHRPGYFRLKMYEINGELLPIWTVPVQLWGQRLFMIRADSGEMFVEKGAGFIQYRGSSQ
jgi:hypothetical protein